jgi:transcriptional regulator with XRE-family HTH domain
VSDGAGDELAARLNRLFDEVRDESGRPFGNAEVAEAIKHNHREIQVSDAYLRQLRRGDKRNPSFDLLKAIAEFFGVPATYWLEEKVKKTEAQILAARLSKNHGVRNLAARASNLTPEGLAAALSVVEAMLAAQGKKTGPHEKHPRTNM